jgi:hypothetical protein
MNKSAFWCGRMSSMWQTSSLKRSWYSWTETVKGRRASSERRLVCTVGPNR